MEGQLVKCGCFLNASINDFAFATNFTSCQAPLRGDGYLADLFFILPASMWMNLTHPRSCLLVMDME